ncbi:MAG TPA: Wzz/FepE/Etk N-terminal domain-containing protein, partial [Acidimicrobiales bacterium]|nr:Wzz/FepE/Etk N-terminal domain-containing protein [Acidimicrobiales bacterium]
MSTRQMDPLETSLRQVDPANLSATGLDIPPLGLDEHEATETYVGRVVDLSLLKQALKRRRRLWASLALLGAAIGAAFPLVVPSQYQGVSNIYLTEPSGPASQAEMADDLSLLQTLAVAAKAVSLLHLHQSPVSFAQTYTGTPLSDVILQIQLSAPTQAEAVAYTNGLAKAFLDVRSSQVTYQTQLGVNALNSQVQGLNNAIASLSSQIDQLSARAANTASSSQLTQLIDSRSNDYGEVSQLQTQV